MKHDFYINPEVLLKFQITPNQCFFLECVKEGLVDLWYHVSTVYKLSDSELQELVDKGLLVNNNKPNERYFKRFEITPLISSLESNTEDFEFIDSFLSMFPQSVGNRLLLANKSDVNKMFKLFFKTYDYKIDEVLKGTEMYINNENKNEFGKYIMNPLNFIYKDRQGSTLAMYCELIRQGESVVNNDWTQQNIN